MLFFPRRIYLALAGVDLHMFKALQRRNQVPLMGGTLDGLAAQDAGKLEKFFEKADNAGYSAADAIMLAIADHMVTSNSFFRSSAKRLVQGYWNILPNAVRRAEAGEVIWCAFGSWDFGHVKQADDEGNRAHWSFAEAGTFDEVFASLRTEQSRTAEQGGIVDNIAMFDLSLIVRQAQSRAENSGIEIGSFFPKIVD